jgi:Zn-finger nucleic acid-binding protein
MNCRNCGGTMALAESRRHFICRHCGTSHFPDASDADGVQVLGVDTTSSSCPVCKMALAHGLLYGEPVETCTACRGMLIPRTAFAGLVQTRRLWATGPTDTIQPLDRRALERQLACPQCERPFDTHPYGGPGNVVIDGCSRCNVVWLDYGELRRIINAPGSDRGRRTP